MFDAHAARAALFAASLSQSEQLAATIAAAIGGLLVITVALHATLLPVNVWRVG